MKKIRLKGSYTIEASFILPMILTLIVAVIYLSFYFHDREVLSEAAYICSLRGSQMINGEDIFSQIEKCSSDMVKNRLLATSELETNINITSKEISVEYKGLMHVPTGVVLCKYLFGNTNGIEVRAFGKSYCQNPVKFIRTCRQVEHVVSAIGEKND